MESFFTALERQRLVPIDIFPSVFGNGNLLVFNFPILALAVIGRENKNERCDKESACTKRSTRRILAYENGKNDLKRTHEKRKTAEFRKRISAKIAVFSSFKSVNRSNKSDDTKT